MAWKIIRNSEPEFRDYTFCGKCPLSGKEAEVTVHCVGTLMCRSDLQKTYRPSGYKCSLLMQGNHRLSSQCMESCPLIPEKYI